MILRLKPSLTAFKDIFWVRLSNSSHVANWVTFSHRRGYKIVVDLPDSQKGYRTKFSYLYNSRG